MNIRDERPGQRSIPRSGDGAPSRFDIVGIAASAGGLNALSTVLGGLPADFPLPVVVVQHLDPRHRTLLDELLRRRTSLEVKQAEVGDSLRPGTVFIAPPNRHLLVDPGGRLSLTESEVVHFVRPSADLLFESMAGSFRNRSIAVVLSGTGVDGATGVDAISNVGGTVIVQDPESAEFDGMPSAAVEKGADFVLPLDEIAGALRLLVSGDDAP